jgi:hypothetical protein
MFSRCAESQDAPGLGSPARWNRVYIHELCHPGVVPFREINRLDFRIAARIDIQ